ncbi:MAG: hypothetical protein HFF52_04480 [Lawsonibacter sp.]|nr:hypothetical protein [Lawsonibacter sp.]
MMKKAVDLQQLKTAAQRTAAEIEELSARCVTMEQVNRAIDRAVTGALEEAY